MVGLSIVLEGQKSTTSSSSTKKATDNYNNTISPQVINKTTMITNKPSPSSSSNFSFHNNQSASLSSSFSSSCGFGPTFLDQCFLCNQKLLPSKDIYMYKGDRAFCSVECRYRQIFMDEEESFRKDNCSMAATKPTSSSSSSNRHRKGTRNRAL